MPTKPDYTMSDGTLDEMPPTKTSTGKANTATIATAGGTAASLILWIATIMTGVQKDVVRVEAIQQAQAQQIITVVARVDKTETTLTDLVKKSERVLAILEQMQRQDDRGVK